ncbi:rho guanine nucleotide exchange factor 17 isoform X2 [Protopterus annectens]|uniref:rho guanine nucleotide exchange factor 17 isoform X2 n=1 Tax=Protopterus annectens TaxID=7888 RepID=UPI001CFBE891|nr:rho guanine nucleotide exchange factor 17 isoform X2 [Protopterus annectens]
MAEKSERKVTIYRSVSFKRLENWVASNLVEGEDQQGRTAQPPHHNTELPASGIGSASSGVVRKVSKLTSANIPDSESKTSSDSGEFVCSASVRELSERFNAAASQLAVRSPRKVDGEGGGDWQVWQSDENGVRELLLLSSDREPSGVCNSRAHEHKCEKDALTAAPPGHIHGSRDPSPVSGNLQAASDEFHNLMSQDEQLLHETAKGVQGFRDQTHRLEPANASDLLTTWPSVSAMRKLFGENLKKQHRTPSDADDPKLQGCAAGWKQSRGPEKGDSPIFCHTELRSSSIHSLVQSQPLDITSTSSKAYSNYPPDQNASTREKYRRGAEKLSSPKPPPPPPPPRSSVPFTLKLHSVSCGLHKQEAIQRSDSLHSLHTSSKPQTVPSTATLRGSSSDEALHKQCFQISNSANKNGSRIRSQTQSSGSEEEDLRPLACRGNFRKRSPRKKKKDVMGSREKGDSDDSDGQVMDPTRKYQKGFPASYLDQLSGKCDTMKSIQSSAHLLDCNNLNVCTTQPSENKQSNLVEGCLQTSGLQEGFKKHLVGSGTISPVNSFQPTSVSSIPVLSRIAKVSIPPFASSPCDSRNSSRYSSTETLKGEDCFNSGGLSKSLQGNFNIYRSPSLGHGDSVSKSQVRIRPVLPLGIVKVKSEEGEGSSYSPEKDRVKQRKSVSNPDIASETLTLLNFLKSDLQGLKVGKRDKGSTDQDGYNYISGGYGSQIIGHSSLQRSRSSQQTSSRQIMGERPTLKDLTATLRRAKSFTYSDKPALHRLQVGQLKQSSSELALAGIRGSDSPDSDGGKMTFAVQDEYLQEARQVFEKISRINQMEVQTECVSIEDNKFMKCGEEVESTKYIASLEDEVHVKCIKKAESDGNLSCGRSLEELSGHESSMTDEGIVTEPEMGSSNTSYKDSSGQTLTVWKVTTGFQGENGSSQLNSKAGITASATVRTGYESVAIGGDSVYTKVATAGPLEAPSTPSAIRRRRKFSAAGNNGSDSSNGSNGESSGETFRSLSDPIPHRRCSVTEESKNFSVDSNLLGSLNAKTGIPELSTISLSEFTGSAASDLSVCSDGLKDYNTVIKNIVSQPGAMDKLIDDKGNTKTIKKKSFSDPSRRGDASTPGFKGPSEPISEMDQVIPASSSEPILSEQRDVLGELEELSKESGKPRSQSERVLPLQTDVYPVDEHHPFGFDPKLEEVLSPRTVRRISKKRNNRVAYQDSRKTFMATIPGHAHILRSKTTSKHVRHASEPATFVPVTTPDLQSLDTSEPVRSPLKPCPAVHAPSLEDVTKQYMLTLNSGDGFGSNLVDISRSTPATPTTTDTKLPRIPKPEDLCIVKSKPQVDMRKHVMLTLLDTEQSYVESLRTLVQGYMKPLKQPENSSICDPSLVDEMFYQIPELLEHHEQFLEEVQQCVQDWHELQKVGDLLALSFSKDILVNIYTAYIDNFLNARDAVRLAKEAKPAFLKFLEQCTRENKEKQALSDLMIKPVQRIPRYELLVKDLLKHTSEQHPDYTSLLDAQKNIKQLAERINKGRKNAEEVEREARILQEIESHIEGIADLLAPHRKFLRQEMVVELKAVGGKKDRSLFLFTDLLVCTTLKRKSGSLRRSSMSLYSAASVIDTSSKYKFLWKLPLEDVEIVKGASQATNRESIQKAIGRLDEDLSTLGQISKLSETLSFPHQSLDDVIKDLMTNVHRELAEKQSLSFSMAYPPNKVELSATTSDGTETFLFEFSSSEVRHGFEQAFEDAKKKLALKKDHWDPEFLKAIPIMKTRSGMQFSCASASHSGPENAYEVWVCNSDGYVGQVCLLSIRDEPTVEACIAVCSSRIICIASVPGLKGNCRERPESMISPSSEQSQPFDETTTQQHLHISISGSSLELSEPMDNGSREIMPFDSDDTDDESSPSPSSTLQSQASRSTISSSFGIEEPVSSKDITAETTSSEEEQEPGFLPIPNTFVQTSSSEISMDGQAVRRSSRGSFTRGSLEDLLSIDPEAYQSSVWLGTEDGCIHVYQSSDNIRNRKNSMKMQQSAAVLCILYLDNQVFVSLANGELIVYHREAGSFWDPQNSRSLCLGSPGSPVTKMVSVSGKLWCGCQNQIIILNTTSLAQEHTFQIGQDSSRSVTCMVVSCIGVWIALQGSAQVKLYHATTFENLVEVDVAPPVHKMLAGSDAIIRQHKAACLRITALLACKDLLWIGTSAGVVLTLHLPHITPNTGSLRTPLVPMGSAHGHTGHVRFLTSIELPDGFNINFPLPRDAGNSAMNNERPAGLQRRDSLCRRPSTVLPAKSNILVISGGDGYEDFRLTNSSETVGRDDSTNHLLLWRV